MAVLGHNDLRVGTKIEVDGEPFNITDTDFIKPGKGTAFTRFKAKSLLTGRVIERTVKANEKIDSADIRVTEMQYLYSDGENWHFMEPKTCEQIEVGKDQVGEAWAWLKENTDCKLMFHNDVAISVEPPTFVVLKVAECEPGVRGDTVSGVTKKATMETGGVVDVPLFINEGELLKIDTRTGIYVERAKE